MSLETLTNYGIKTDHDTFVLDIGYFNNSDVPKDYLEISEYQYFQFIDIVKPYSKFDGTTLTIDPQDEIDYLQGVNIAKLRDQLKDLSIEIDLAGRMNEDATTLQTEFDNLKTQYTNLTTPTP